jgi:cytochrome c-type protein NapB
MINKKVLMAISVSALLLGGCFNSETGASQRAANGETETHAPAKHEAKAEAPKVEEKAPAKAEEKAPAKAEEKAPAKAEEKAPAKAEEKAPAKAEEKAPAKAEEKAPATAAAAPDLGVCKGCHGANFEKKAMGKSKEVNTMSKADIATALKGYKDGSYGGAMKGIMKGQVASFDDAAIEAIANTIGK